MGWASIASPKTFKIDFHPGSTSHSEFQELVAGECNNQFTSAGPLIRDSLTQPGALPIEWSVYLLRSPSLPEFSKDSNFVIDDLDSYTHWTESATGLDKAVVNCCLKLATENPSAIEKQKVAATEVQNHLMSAEAACNASSSRRRITDASNDPTLQFEDTVNIHMESLYQRHQPNAKYEKDFPVFLHPNNPN